MNDDDGYVLNDTWKPLVPILSKQTLETFGEASAPTTYNNYNLRISTRAQRKKP